MVSRRTSEPQPEQTPRRPATTPDGRESQLIALAVDAVEKRIQNGTASAQELVHFLKLGSSRERLEQERLENENALLGVKREALESATRMESLVEEALAAFRTYSGTEPPHPDEYYDD